MTERRGSLLGLLAGLSVATAAVAQPAPSAGDTWIFRNADRFTDLETGRFALVFVRQDARSLHFRATNLKTGSTGDRQLSLNLGPCAWRNGVEVCAEPYRFPMQVGRRHGWQDMPAGGSTQDLDCEVKGFEKVTVPAGTFDAFRVECEGRWTFKTSDFAFRGRLWNSYWYAPAVNHEVKATWRAYRQNGGLDSYAGIDLVEFRPAGADGAATMALPVAPEPAPALPAEFSVGGTRFSGRFVSDPGARSYSGEGRVAWANGDVYEGGLVKGAREGRGSFVWADGQRYEGEWSGDKPNGHGRLVFVNGDRYEGRVEDGRPNGPGAMDYASGARHVGAFVDGLPQGQGRFRSATGQTVDADWRAGRAVGPAFIEFANGDRYDGTVDDGVPNGDGKLLYASGDTYVGRFVAGRADGTGVYTWKSGDRYEGAWKAGRKHGTGRFTWASGDRWDGVFVEDERSADGTLTRRSP